MTTNTQYKYIVVEDESLIRRNVIKKIESLSLPLLLAGEASNGLDAQKLIEEVSPNLVITDIRMPQYDGLMLASHIQKNHPSIKTIILSGYSEFSYAQTAIKYGVLDYLLKPITAEALNDSLQHILIAIESEHEEFQNAQDLHTLSQEEICELMISYLRKNYQSEISLNEMADKFGFTVEYLGKIFKKQTGEPPSKYLTKLRINEAKYLLANRPDLEIGKIGEIVGYKDGFYFSRVFKSNLGMHPSDYRMLHGDAPC